MPASAAAGALPRHSARREDLRRALHAATGVLGPLLLWLPGRAAGWLLAGLAALALLAEAGRRAVPAIRRGITATVGDLFRADEASGLSGPATLALGYAAAWWVFPPRAAALGIVVTALADPAAALAGRRFGHGGRKTWAGSFACALVAASVGVVGGAGALPSAAGGVVAALAERAPWRGADNLLVPLAAGATFALLAPA